MSVVKGLSISESKYGLPNGKEGKIAVFVYVGNSNPQKVLDKAVRTYCGNYAKVELIDSGNPQMRVVISNINDMEQEKFDTSKHRL